MTRPDPDAERSKANAGTGRGGGPSSRAARVSVRRAAPARPDRRRRTTPHRSSRRSDRPGPDGGSRTPAATRAAGPERPPRGVARYTGSRRGRLGRGCDAPRLLSRALLRGMHIAEREVDGHVINDLERRRDEEGETEGRRAEGQPGERG